MGVENKIRDGVAHQSNRPLTEVTLEENITAPQPGALKAEVKAGESSGAAGDMVVGGKSVAPTPEAKGDPSNNNNEGEADKREREEAVIGLDQAIDMLKQKAASVAPEDEETRKKREKRERSRKIISAVSDGLSALGNLFFTTQYAPEMYKGSPRMLDRVTAQIERAKAERERNNDLYFNYSMKIADKENEKAHTLSNLAAQQAARKIAQQKAEDAHKAAEADRALDPFRLDKAKNDSEKSGHEAEYSRLKTENAPEELRLKNKNLELQGQVHQSSINKNNAQASNANRGNRNEFSAWDENGKEHKFKTQAAAESYAKQHGTWKEIDEITETETDSEYNGVTNKTERKKGGYPGRPSKGTMPGVKINDNKKMPGVK